jgi:hypothetical protein
LFRVNGFDETLHSAVQLGKYANLGGAGSAGTAMEIEEPGFDILGGFSGPIVLPTADPPKNEEADANEK